jgi:hypothetical protein
VFLDFFVAHPPIPSSQPLDKDIAKKKNRPSFAGAPSKRTEQPQRKPPEKKKKEPSRQKGGMEEEVCVNSPILLTFHEKQAG